MKAVLGTAAAIAILAGLAAFLDRPIYLAMAGLVAAAAVVATVSVSRRRR